MASFDLFDQRITIPDSYIRNYNMNRRSTMAAEAAKKEFGEWYDRCHSIDVVLSCVDDIACDLVAKYAAQPLYDELRKMKIYDVSEERYTRECVDMRSCEIMIISIEEKLLEISGNQEAMREYRAARKASRGRFVGGGFGISGAVAGAMKAGAMNAASGMAHGLVNTIGNAGSAVAATAKKALLYGGETKDDLAYAISDSIRKTFENYKELVNEHHYNYYVDGFEPGKAVALFENAQRLPEKRTELLAQAIKENPYEPIFDYIFENYPEQRISVYKMGKAFGYDYWKQLETAFEKEYTNEIKDDAKKSAEYKESVCLIMKECGVTTTKILDEINYNELNRIIDPYVKYPNGTNVPDTIERFKEYDAPDAQKGKVVKNSGVWELASTYRVEFTPEEVDKILGRYYPKDAKYDEDKAQDSKAKIKKIMTVLGVSSSETFDQLEKDCIARLCPKIDTADESACNKMRKDIQAYDALEKNKKPYIDEIEKRIEAIWSKEDGEIFDSIYLNTNLYNSDEINNSLEIIKQKGRTDAAQKYIDALEACNKKNINKAQKYQKKSTRLYRKFGIALTVLGIAMAFASPVLGVVAAVGIFFLIVHQGRKKYWKLLTINETQFHEDIINPKAKQKTVRKESVVVPELPAEAEKEQVAKVVEEQNASVVAEQNVSVAEKQNIKVVEEQNANVVEKKKTGQNAAISFIAAIAGWILVFTIVAPIITEIVSFVFGVRVFKDKDCKGGLKVLTGIGFLIDALLVVIFLFALL